MTDFSQLQKSAQTLQEEFDRVTSEFKTKMQEMFTDMTKSFFEAAPEIKAVIWSQYTPYFNDGDECIFGINEMNFLTEYSEDATLPRYVYDLDNEEIDGISVFDINASQENLEYYTDAIKRYGDSSYYQQKIKSIEEALKNPRHDEISKLCKGLSRVIIDNEDLMKSVFGDHVIVILTPNGSSTEDCEHD
jgi:hypothetical protein